MTEFPRCPKCGCVLHVGDNFVNGGLISMNVDGHAKAAHRFCPDSEEMDLWKQSKVYVLAEGYAHGLARAARRDTPNKDDWAKARLWAATRADAPGVKA